MQVGPIFFHLKKKIEIYVKHLVGTYIMNIINEFKIFFYTQIY